jgi:predicted nuclease of predicted toxin-antitoxin system
MNIYLDDDSASRQLSMLLQNAGHKIPIPVNLGISGAPDPMHLTQAIRRQQILLTRNARDFSLLHELVITSGGGHPGILLLHFDNDPTRDLTAKGTVAAIAKLENSGLRLSNTLHVLNHWR